MSSLQSDEQVVEDAPVSNNGAVDLLDSSATNKNTNTGGADSDETKVEKDDAAASSLDDLSSGKVNQNSAAPKPSIATVAAIVNEVRGISSSNNSNNDNVSESPLISRKLEAMEQGSRYYRDDPNEQQQGNYGNGSSSSSSGGGGNTLYYSSSSPPAGIWKDNYEFNNNRSGRDDITTSYSFIGSCLRSKFCTYSIIVTTLICIGVGISAAITKGFDHVHHRSELLHPKWEQGDNNNNGIVVIQEEGDPNGGEGEDGEEVLWMPPNTQHNEGESSIMQPTDVSQSIPDEVYTSSQGGNDIYLSGIYIPLWFHRETGWSGSTHAEAVQFCQSEISFASNNYVPCPYDVYCPSNDNGRLIFDEEMDEVDSWAPTMKTNQWVQVGSGGGACSIVEREALDERLTRHIMCCLEEPLDLGGPGSSVQAPPSVIDEGGGDDVEDPIPPPPMSSSSMVNTAISASASDGVTMSQAEQAVFDKFRPFWFSDEEGWSGTTHNDAKQFCESIQNGPNPEDTLHLCEAEAYCPNGSVDFKPLYYQMDAYEGEQWSPIDSDDDQQQWIFVGSLGREICHLNQPGMPVDELPKEVKKHVMCCQKPSGSSEQSTLAQFDFEGSVISSLNPKWFGSDEWIAGSHDDAIHFCDFKGKDLCPYAAYCPYGPGNAPIESDTLINEEQWAPIKSNEPESNQWVQIGTQNDDPSTQCVIKDSPAFGFDTSEPDLKLHIMCCDKADQPSETTVGESIKPVEESILTAAESSDSNAVWYNANDGWNGGSHESAILFCLGKKQTLCSVETLCPSGPNWPPLSGHGELGLGEDFEQWAPAIDKENYWIMIGWYDMDETTQCLSQDDLLGSEPSWGLDESNSEHKRHILCC